MNGGGLKREIGAMRRDVALGMVFSNIVMFFIMVTAGSVFQNGGLSTNASVADVASALRPLAGQYAFLLFALGVVGTGLLAIPVLAGSAAYALSEAFGWQEGLSKKFHEAAPFYLTIIAATAIGFLMTLMGMGAVQMLYLTALVYGLLSPPLIAIILGIANSAALMGKHVNGWLMNLLGGAALLLMTAAVGALVFVSF